MRYLATALTLLMASAGFAEDRTKADPKLKALFQKSGWIFSGTYRGSKGYDPGGNPQTIYSFTGCQHFKQKINFGPIRSDKETSIGVYKSSPALNDTKPGTEVLVFLPTEYGKVLEVRPLKQGEVRMIKKWASGGTYTKEERKALFKKSEWVVVVGKAREICLESFPCQHHWTFPVIKSLKGKGIPKQLRIRGSYRSHNDIPEPLKVSSANGRLILFMDANGQKDTSVKGAIPWSAELEKELSK